MDMPLIEGCVDSYESCAAACRGGADRLELCANLSIGGTTPSPAFFRQVKRDFSVPVHVLIRPRFGDFLYTREELAQMEEEIRMFRELACQCGIANLSHQKLTEIACRIFGVQCKRIFSFL